MPTPQWCVALQPLMNAIPTGWRIWYKTSGSPFGRRFHLNNQAAIKSYVARIAQNICVTHVRRALVRHTEPLDDTLADPAPPLDDATAHVRRLACLVDAVRSLPENLKTVASLYLEDIPIKDIALALGISESNASVRLHRAKSAIRLKFGETS
jgi:RNA polymerase sigma factor (sigma-70 family)